MSPLVDGDLVIVSAAISSWGAQANRAHRFVALDKRTGDIVWVAHAGRPAVRHRLRGADHRHDQRPAAAHRRHRRRRGPRDQAADRREGLELRGRQARDQHRRGRQGHDASSSRTATRTSTRASSGMIAAIDGSQTGDIKTTKWAVKGDQFGFSSPVIDGTRVYQIDNGSRLKAFDLETGRELWRQPLGTGAEGAARARRRQAVRRHRERQVLHRPAARRPRRGAERGRAADEQETARSSRKGRPSRCSPAPPISRGRVFFVSSDAVYAIGPKAAKALDRHAPSTRRPKRARARRRSCRCRRPNWC